MQPCSLTAGGLSPRCDALAYTDDKSPAFRPILRLTSALIGGVLLLPAPAAGLEANIGGFMTQCVGYAFNDGPDSGDVSGLDTQNDGEIHFSAAATLDNGIRFGVQVQLEAETSDDQIDESFAFVRGAFGELLLGSEDGAAYAMHYGVASQGIGLDDGEAGSWILGLDSALFTTASFFLRDDDANKIRYISPRQGGFQVGVSYAPEGREDDDALPTEADNNGRAAEQIIQAAVNYENTLGDLSVAASLGTEVFGDVNGTSDQGAYIVAGGLLLGHGPFGASFAASYENEPAVGYDRRTVVGGSAFYAAGPAGVSLAMMYGVAEPDSGSDDAQVSVELGGHYNLGPGVTAQGSVYYADHDAGTGADSSGFAVVGGISLEF